MRDGILGRVRKAVATREAVEHPGAFPGPPGDEIVNTVELFEARFTEAGGEVVRLDSLDDAREWLSIFAASFEGVSVGALVPPELSPELPETEAEGAPLGISMARGAAAFTGSLLLDSRGGRRCQLLPPTHLVWVREETILPTLGELLAQLGEEPTSALALHSGPSKSADIGQILVRGVHGPGRVVTAILAPQGTESLL